MSLNRRSFLRDGLAAVTTASVEKAVHSGIFLAGMAVSSEAQILDPREVRFRKWMHVFESDKKTKSFLDKFTPIQQGEIGRATAQIISEIKRRGYRNGNPFLIVQDELFRGAVVKQLRKNNFPTDRVVTKEDQDALMTSVEEFLKWLAEFPQDENV